jgi:uncharacterized protein YbdZ (MbtH family)
MEHNEMEYAQLNQVVGNEEEQYSIWPIIRKPHWAGKV